MPERFGGYNPEGQPSAEAGQEQNKLLKKKRQLYVIDISHHLEQEARDAAEAKLTADRDKAGFFSRIWKHNLWREVIRQRELGRAREKINEQNNIFAAHESAPDLQAARDAEMNAIVERFASGYEDALRQSGKEKELIIVENDPAIKSAIRQLVIEYAQGKLNEQAFDEEKARIFSKIAAATKELIGGAGKYIDTITAFAKEAKTAVDHGAAVEQLDLDFELIIGRARSSVRTEAHLNSVDKIVEKIKNNRIGAFVNETTLATAVAVAYTLATRGSQTAASRYLGWGTFGATAAIGSAVAGAKESARLEEERRLHGRQMAKGGKFNANEKEAPRRAEMEKFRAETKGANELADELEAALYKGGDGRTLANLSKDEFYDAARKVADIQARIRFGDQHGVDLIHYSDPRKIEQESTRLQILLAQAKVKLRKFAEEDSTAKGFLEKGQKFDELIEKDAQSETNAIVYGEKGIERKNAAFKKMKHARVAKTAAMALFIGAGIGAAAQEGAAVFSHSREGAVSAARDWVSGKPEKLGQHYTALGGLVRWLHGETAQSSAQMHSVNIAGWHSLSMPAGYEVVKDHAGHFNLMYGDKVISSHIMNGNGAWVPGAHKILSEHGIVATDTFKTSFIAAGPEHIAAAHPAEASLAHGAAAHGAAESGAPYQNMAHIKRGVWLDANSDTPIKNAIRLSGTGHGGPAINSDGNFVYNISHMTPDGSYHQGISVNAPELMRQGKLYLAVSVSRNSQNYVFQVPIHRNGQIVFDRNSPLAHLLFGKFKNLSPEAQAHLERLTHGYHFSGNDTVFKGAYAEVVQATGLDKAGTEHVRILATDVGANTIRSHHLTGQPYTLGGGGSVESGGNGEIRRQMFSILNHPNDFRWYPPVWFPILGRRPLEKTIEGKPAGQEEQPAETPLVPEFAMEQIKQLGPRKEPRLLGPGKEPKLLGPAQFVPIEPSRLEKYEPQFSPALRENPDADLKEQNEIGEYSKRFSPEYKKQIEQNAQTMEPMAENCKLSVMIPVAGHHEGKKIYKTLELYAKQRDSKGNLLDGSAYEIVLFVNNPETDKKGRKLNSKNTLQAIAKFKKDYPKINVRVFSQTLPNAEAKIGHIRRILADTVLQRENQRKRESGNLILVSNDADISGMPPKYLSNFIDRFEQNPNVDCYVGQIDFDPRVFAGNPEMYVGDKFAQYIQNQKSPYLLSMASNSAFKAGTYAAVGGYGDAKAESAELSTKFMLARAKAKGHIGLAHSSAKVSRLYTGSERKMSAAFAQRLLKGKKNSEIFPDFDNERERGNFMLKVELEINKALKDLKLNVGDSKVLKALDWAGIEFEPSPDGIRIMEASKLIEGLRRYQEEWREIFGNEAKKKKREAVSVSEAGLSQPIEISPQEIQPKEQPARESQGQPIEDLQKLPEQELPARESSAKESKEIFKLDEISAGVYQYLKERGYHVSAQAIRRLKLETIRVIYNIRNRYKTLAEKPGKDINTERNEAVSELLSRYAENSWKLKGKDMEAVARMDFPFRGNISEDLLALDKALSQEKGFAGRYAAIAGYVYKNPDIAARMLKEDVVSWLKQAHKSGTDAAKVAKVFIYSQVLDQISIQLGKTAESAKQKAAEFKVAAGAKIREIKQRVKESLTTEEQKQQRFEEDIRNNLEPKIEEIFHGRTSLSKPPKTADQIMDEVERKISAEEAERKKAGRTKPLEEGAQADNLVRGDDWPYSEMAPEQAVDFDKRMDELARIISSPGQVSKSTEISAQLKKMHLPLYGGFTETAREILGMNVPLTSVPEVDYKTLGDKLRNDGFITMRLGRTRGLGRTIERRIESLLKDLEKDKENPHNKVDIIKLMIYRRIVRQIIQEEEDEKNKI